MVDCRHRDVERGDTRFSLCREISLDNLEAKERVGNSKKKAVSDEAELTYCWLWLICMKREDSTRTSIARG